MRPFFLPKVATDTRNCDFDFAGEMSYGETIDTNVVTATVWSGTDASPSSLISGVPSSTGGVVTQAITGGVTGVIYELTCEVTTSLGQTLQSIALLAIEQDVV